MLRKTAINFPAKVAIITRTRNRPVFLRRAAACLGRQLFHDWVHVIVNDGGKPQAVESVVAELPKAQQQRTRVIHHHVPKGMEAASNTGMRACQSEYLVVLDDDDTWSPHFLDTCVAFLDNPDNQGLGGVVTRTACIAEVMVRGCLVPVGRKAYNPALSKIDFVSLLNRRLFTQNALLFRRSCQEHVGFFREDFCVLGDWEFDLRFVNQFRVGVIPKVLAYNHQRRFVKHGVACNQTTMAGLEPFSHFARLVRTEWREVAHGQGVNVDDLDTEDLDPTFLMKRESDPAMGRLVGAAMQAGRSFWRVFSSPAVEPKLPAASEPDKQPLD